MDREGLISERLLVLLHGEIAGLEAAFQDFSPNTGDANPGRGSPDARAGGKERIERIAQATRTFEKLMELKRAEMADADRLKDEDAEAERMRDELLARLEVIDRRRMAAITGQAGAGSAALETETSEAGKGRARKRRSKAAKAAEASTRGRPGDDPDGR